MKTLIISGSPRLDGNTFTSAQLINNILIEKEIESEIYNLADKNFAPCTACGSCFKTKNNRCIINDDLNDLIQKCLDIDGLIISSPIHFADIAAKAKNAYDRLFYVSTANDNIFRHKVGASFVAVRRSGGIAGFHTLNNYLMYAEMFVATSSYWNIVHGNIKGEVKNDNEGVFTLENLAENFVFLLNAIDSNKVNLPIKKTKPFTNFVRDDLK